MTLHSRSAIWLLAAVAVLVAGTAGPARAADVFIGLITKTDSNPFFVKMREGADATAKKVGARVQSFAGKFDGDNDTQVAAIENLISAGAKGILITPSDTKAIVPTVKKARDAGILVIALDTPLEPIEAADATFATDNFKAGLLIGEWAAKTLGAKTKTAHVAFLDDAGRLLDNGSGSPWRVRSSAGRGCSCSTIRSRHSMCTRRRASRTRSARSSPIARRW